MRLDLMKVFLAILEGGSLAAAARRCHITQPAVSVALNMLEKEIGHQLLSRTPGQRQPPQLTPTGAIFADYARKALEDYEDMLAEISSKQPRERPFVVGLHPRPVRSLRLFWSAISKRLTSMCLLPSIRFQVRKFFGV